MRPGKPFPDGVWQFSFRDRPKPVMTGEAGNVHNRIHGEGIMTAGLYKSPDGCIRISMTTEMFGSEYRVHLVPVRTSPAPGQGDCSSASESSKIRSVLGSPFIS